MGHDRLVRALLAGVAACTAVPQAASAQAQARLQAWPQKAVRIIVPQSPGGSTDAMARLLAARLGVELPITAAVVAALEHGVSIERLAEGLLGRAPTAEWH